MTAPVWCARAAAFGKLPSGAQGPKVITPKAYCPEALPLTLSGPRTLCNACGLHYLKKKSAALKKARVTANAT